MGKESRMIAMFTNLQLWGCVIEIENISPPLEISKPCRFFVLPEKLVCEMIVIFI